MASFPFPDIFGMPSSGNTANLSSIIVQSGKAAKNQYAGVSLYPNHSYMVQPTGIGNYLLLKDRYEHGQIVSIGQ